MDAKGVEPFPLWFACRGKPNPPEAEAHLPDDPTGIRVSKVDTPIPSMV